MNNSNKYVQKIEHKKHYMYDYYIQLNLSTVNGNSLKHILNKNNKTNKKESAKDKKKNENVMLESENSNEEIKSLHEEIGGVKSD